MAKARLKEVAALAGVSISTVSRVINSLDGSFASSEVQKKVWNAVKELNYIPNQNAQKLRSPADPKSNLSSHAIACIFGREKSPDNNPFFATIARSIEQQALQMGYLVSSSYSIFDLDNKLVWDRLSSLKVDGAAILGRFEKNTYSFFEKQYKNLVYIGLNSPNIAWDQVICDGYGTAETAVSYLIKRGHHRIGYIGETHNEIRYTAYKDTLTRNNIPIDRNLIGQCSLDGYGGYSGATKLLNSSSEIPSAVLCGNDITAIAAIKRFNEAKLNIPNDISVISIDNIELSQFVTPLLTTISVPQEELGKTAVKLLVDRINHGHSIPRKVILPHRLVVRDSVLDFNGSSAKSFTK